MSKGWGQIQTASRQRIQYFLRNLAFDIRNWLGNDDRHPPNEFAQREIRRAAALEKIDRVLGFSRASLNWIGIQHEAYIWLRNEREQQSDIRSLDSML